MIKVKLKFVKSEYVDILLSDSYFLAHTSYLNPIKSDNFNIIFTDNVEEHDILDTEMVALEFCAHALSRILFKGECHIGLLNSNAMQMKKGVVLSFPDKDNVPIITNTEIVQ